MTDAQTDRMLKAHKFSPEGSIWAPESLQQVRDRLEFIDAHECDCGETPHESALHDLAHDDVPVLLKVIERQAAEVERLRSYKSLPPGMVWQDYYSPDDVCKVRAEYEAEIERLQAARRGESRRLVETHNERADLLREVERLRATVERVRQLAHNPETYSGTGVVTVTPRRILAALDADR